MLLIIKHIIIYYKLITCVMGDIKMREIKKAPYNGAFEM